VACAEADAAAGEGLAVRLGEPVRDAVRDGLRLGEPVRDAVRDGLRLGEPVRDAADGDAARLWLAASDGTPRVGDGTTGLPLGEMAAGAGDDDSLTLAVGDTLVLLVALLEPVAEAEEDGVLLPELLAVLLPLLELLAVLLPLLLAVLLALLLAVLLALLLPVLLALLVMLIVADWL
jgi:hypothetical protein